MGRSKTTDHRSSLIVRIGAVGPLSLPPASRSKPKPILEPEAEATAYAHGRKTVCGEKMARMTRMALMQQERSAFAMYHGTGCLAWDPIRPGIIRAEELFRI